MAKTGKRNERAFKNAFMKQGGNREKEAYLAAGGRSRSRSRRRKGPSSSSTDIVTSDTSSSSTDAQTTGNSLFPQTVLSSTGNAILNSSSKTSLLGAGSSEQSSSSTDSQREDRDMDTLLSGDIADNPSSNLSFNNSSPKNDSEQSSSALAIDITMSDASSSSTDDQNFAKEMKNEIKAFCKAYVEVRFFRGMFIKKSI